MKQFAPFKNRAEAGKLLAQRLTDYAQRSDVIVLALPRGGVEVAVQIARQLEVTLDVLVVRKLGLPGREELAIGAIASGDVCVLDSSSIAHFEISQATVDAIRERETSELKRREQLYRSGKGPLQLQGKVVILVDDGIATGSTMHAAVQLVRKSNPARVMIAVPVASVDSCHKLATEVDQLVCLCTPEPLYAVGLSYDEFGQSSDDEVLRLLKIADQRRRRSGADVQLATVLHNELIRIQVGPARIEGMLSLPGLASGLVVFVHGSGSNRHSPRNNYVAEALHRAGLGTLLVDLLTPEEESKEQQRFNIPLLTRRLSAAVDRLGSYELTSAYTLGLFGASTGAAAALQVAVEKGPRIAAVVSRGGRPDLAGIDALVNVRCPTLLIVGGMDTEVVRLNQAALLVMTCEKQIEIVPGATHLFEEPGKMDEVARLACDWFIQQWKPGT